MLVKIFVVDSYQSNPVSGFEAEECHITDKKIPKVPVIRVFGITEHGHKCCVHVHNAFPYLLVPSNDISFEFIQNFSRSLENALVDGSAATFIYNIEPIEAIPIYGYYAATRNFLKLYFVNPVFIKRASEVLLSGKVLGIRFQPHEAHIPYHLQFLINHNLFGMDWMEIKKAHLRAGSLSGVGENCNYFGMNLLPKKSCCAVECDIESCDIENQNRMFGEASVSSLSALWEDERLRRSKHGLSPDDVKLPDSPENRDIIVNEREKLLLQRFVGILSSLAVASSGVHDSSEQLTQLLEGIVDNARGEQNNTWEEEVIYQDCGEVSLTQCLEGIVSGAVAQKSAESEAPKEETYDTTIDLYAETEFEPGSVLSYSRCGDIPGQEEDPDDGEDHPIANAREVMPEGSIQNVQDEVSEDSLEDVDWEAFVVDDEDIEMPPQLDGTQDKPTNTPKTRKRRSAVQMQDIEAQTSSQVITVSSTSSGSESPVTISDNDEAGCSTATFADKRSRRQSDSSLSELGSSSIYSFQGSTIYVASTCDSPILPSPTGTSEASVRIVDSSPSSALSSETPKILDQTSIHFFQDDLTPQFSLNETNVSRYKTNTLRPKRKPPTRGLVDRWLRSESRSKIPLNNTVALELEEAGVSYVEPSRRYPAFTSTPHPSRRSQETATPVSTMLIDTTTVTSPISNSQAAFSFAAKSLKNVEPIFSKEEQSFPVQHVTVFSLELHAISNSAPDPSRDAIAFLSLSKMHCVDISFNNETETVLVVAKDTVGDLANIRTLPTCTSLGSLTVEVVDDELGIILYFLDELERTDPDILCGYEIERASLGYLVQRAMVLQIPDIILRLGRILPDSNYAAAQKGNEVITKFSFTSARGRVFFAIWRLLRHELDHVQSYSFESAAFHVLHRRMPKFDPGMLTWWLRKGVTQCRTFLYYVERSLANIQILVRLNLLSRTSELARLYGILFYDCLSRGSQFRVEAVMLRLAKRLHFIAVSPSIEQRAAQCAPECIPLTLEPISNYYKNPVIVLDFQSLYPSIMIAYNYSFDTCLGRLDRLAKGGPQQLGCFIDGFEVPSAVLGNLSEKDVNISPNGVVFVKRHIRRGVLSAVVEDLLNSRLMVKASMKLYKDDPTITKILHDRQLGLKLLANVTYGYTAANFSGRMPCIEIADAIVRKGREALENAIALVTSRRNEWGGARVIYGDTDSLFVLIPGSTVKTAFEIGAKIAEAVTLSNPLPMKLKLEKVFSRCILEAKKRYCGFMYETPDQKEAEFLSKGIETIRKDQCAYVAKVLEKSIRILFSTDSNIQVMRYLRKEIKKLETGAVQIPDLLLSRQYRGAEGYSEKGSAAAMLIANRRRAANALTEPLAGDRVYYMITAGAPGGSIMQTAREPMEVVADGLRPNVDYYVRRQLLPALDRALGTAGVDVFSLISGGVHSTVSGNVAERNRVRMATYSRVMAASSSKVMTLTQMYTRRQCVICGVVTTSNQNTRKNRFARRAFGKLCSSCRSQPATSSALLSCRAAALQRKVEAVSKVCHSCCRFRPFVSTAELAVIMETGQSRDIFACLSVDCPTFYEQYNRESLLAASQEYENINMDTFSRMTITLDDD